MGDMLNLGAVLLAAWLAREGNSQQRLADAVGGKQSSVSAWLRGRIPTLRMAEALRREAGIALDAWLQPVDIARNVKPRRQRRNDCAEE